MLGKMLFRTTVSSQRGGLEQEDSRAMLRLIYLATGLTIGFFALLQGLNGNLSLALVELIAALLLLAGAYRLAAVHNLTPWIYLYLLPTFSFIIYIIIMPDASVSAFVWVYMIPLMAYLLLGKTAGFYVTVPFAVMAIAAYLIKHPEQFQGTGWIDMGNAVLSGLLIMLFVHVYEARRAAAQRQLRELAETDGLTGVANRSSFQLILNDSIAQAERSGQRLVLVLLDLDHFKAVNDRWGHAAGDQALRHTCDCIQQRLRRNDLMARLGGEEFALLLRDTDAAEARPLVEKLRDRLAASPLHYQQQVIPLSATFGLAEWPLDGADADLLYRRADLRLYRGKHLGRNQLIFHDVLPAEVLRPQANQLLAPNHPCE